MAKPMTTACKLFDVICLQFSRTADGWDHRLTVLFTTFLFSKLTNIYKFISFEINGSGVTGVWFVGSIVVVEIKYLVQFF